MFEFSASEFGTVGMRRRLRACAYEFITTVTKSVVHAVDKVVFWCNAATQCELRYWMFSHCVTRSHMNLAW